MTVGFSAAGFGAGGLGADTRMRWPQRGQDTFSPD
jgi:hypothetical protein